MRSTKYILSRISLTRVLHSTLMQCLFLSKFTAGYTNHRKLVVSRASPIAPRLLAFLRRINVKIAGWFAIYSTSLHRQPVKWRIGLCFPSSYLSSSSCSGIIIVVVVVSTTTTTTTAPTSTNHHLIFFISNVETRLCLYLELTLP